MGGACLPDSLLVAQALLQIELTQGPGISATSFLCGHCVPFLILAECVGAPAIGLAPSASHGRAEKRTQRIAGGPAFGKLDTRHHRHSVHHR